MERMTYQEIWELQVLNPPQLDSKLDVKFTEHEEWNYKYLLRAVGYPNSFETKIVRCGFDEGWKDGKWIEVTDLKFISRILRDYTEAGWNIRYFKRWFFGYRGYFEISRQI